MRPTVKTVQFEKPFAFKSYNWPLNNSVKIVSGVKDLWVDRMGMSMVNKSFSARSLPGSFGLEIHNCTTRIEHRPIPWSVYPTKPFGINKTIRHPPLGLQPRASEIRGAQSCDQRFTCFIYYFLITWCFVSNFQVLVIMKGFIPSFPFTSIIEYFSVPDHDIIVLILYNRK